MTLLELKVLVKALEARVSFLEGLIERNPEKTEKTEKTEKPERKLCPHCNSAPAYFFHVKNCQKKKNKNGNDGIGNPGGS